jgi:NAD(P)-dependent dehydrogenase (short-subunit alcohol dehydrogenase family)
MSLNIDLDGKVAIVTGGGRGIGRAVALHLAEAGARVCVTARSEHEIQATADLIRARGGTAWTIAADATDATAVSRVVEETRHKAGGLHLLINNAGMELAKPLLDTSEAEYERLMATNVKSMFLFTKAVGPHFIAQGFGRIVNMASVGAFIAAPNQAVYHLSKSAVAHFTKAMAIEWARFKISVNAVAPGWIRTELISHLLADPDKLSRYQKAIPMRRIGEPEDIAPMVAFLCSDFAAYMTGSVVVIDGGMMIP